MNASHSNVKNFTHGAQLLRIVFLAFIPLILVIIFIAEIIKGGRWLIGKLPLLGEIPWWVWVLLVIALIVFLLRKKISAAVKKPNAGQITTTAPAKKAGSQEWLAWVIAASVVIILVWFINEVIREWHRDALMQANNTCSSSYIAQDLTGRGTLLTLGMNKLKKGERYLWEQKPNMAYFFDPVLPQGDSVKLSCSSGYGVTQMVLIRHSDWSDVKIISGDKPRYATIYTIIPNKDVQLVVSTEQR